MGAPAGAVMKEAQDAEAAEGGRRGQPQGQRKMLSRAGSKPCPSVLPLSRDKAAPPGGPLLVAPAATAESALTRKDSLRDRRLKGLSSGHHAPSAAGSAALPRGPHHPH